MVCSFGVLFFGGFLQCFSFVWHVPVNVRIVCVI